MSTNVPGQAEGYFLQETRFLVHLLNAQKGDVVSLELLGDVATESADGIQLVEEDKSTIGDNPVTDRSVNLWKTFYNWTKAIQSDNLSSENTQFTIYVPANFDGSFINSLDKANDINSAKEALDSIRNDMWGDAPNYPLKSGVVESICKYTDLVLNPDNESTVTSIITAFTYEKGDNAGYDEIDSLLSNMFLDDADKKLIRTHALGWIKELIDKLISSNQPAKITKDDFTKEIKAYRRKLDRQDILKSLAEEPSKDRVESDIKSQPIYIKQLEIIDLEDDEKFKAATQKLKADEDRFRWIENGMIHKSSAKQLENNLINTHSNLKLQSEVHNDKSPEIQGKFLLGGCLGHTAEIEKQVLPPDYIPGTYHFLADKKILGWHPEWKAKLGEEEPEE